VQFSKAKQEKMAPSKLLAFEGLMAPVFTPFDDSDHIKYELIEPYAQFLQSKGISAVLVNGTTGEGMLLTVAERKKITEKWAEVCKKLNILLMIQVSGCPFVDAVELTKHAASIKVDGVLALPELYFKPKTIEKLVDYLKNLAVHCKDSPFYYYHIPMFTQLDLPMGAFMELAKREIPNFAGIKYTNGDLEKALPCLKHGQVFLGSDTILCGALAQGFTSAICTTLNLKPEWSLQVIEHIKNQEVLKARAVQQQIIDLVETTLREGNGEWVPSMKKKFNESFKHLNMGKPRKPL